LDEPVINTQQELSVYPNPTSEELHIDNTRFSTAYRIYSITGTIVQHGVLKTNNNAITLSDLRTGIYLLTLTDSEGKRMITKFVKQ